MSLAILQQLESEGYFDKAAAGDHRACGLFARLAAYRLNPSGDPAGWGWLRKTGGGANVEGYSEDAIVLGANPTLQNNVKDIIGGAGAPGARVGWGAFVNRRSSDIWERPVPLSAEQMDYLKPGSGHVEPGNPPVPVPVPVPTPPATCRFEPFNLEGLVTNIERLQASVDASQDDVTSLIVEVAQTRLLLADLIARMEQGFVIDANIKYLGAVRGTVRLPKGE